MNTSNTSKRGGGTSVNKQFISNFIFAAISDVAETIKATDAKVGVTFALYSLIILAMAEARMEIRGLIQVFFMKVPCWGVVILILTTAIAFACFLCSVYQLLSTMTPRSSANAIEDCDLSNTHKKMWLVDLAKNDNKKLEITFFDYNECIKNATEDVIIKLEELELLRLNFIRAHRIIHYNSGLKYLKCFLIWFSVSVLLLLISLAIFSK